MTRSHHVTHGRTAERLEKIRKLITTLQAEGYLMRDEIGPMLELGPSGVRKYLADLRGKFDGGFLAGRAIVRLSITTAQADAYLASLAASPPARPVASPQTPEGIAARDSGRHFHILADDGPFHVRVSRAPAARDPYVTALFGAGPASMEARA